MMAETICGPGARSGPEAGILSRRWPSNIGYDNTPLAQA
ncbi:hypothetical protein CyaNS01_00673 [Cyanobium sp. NS01]|nr:hypothetical protein CyaNS01_00673 [Cyanobium sp. NS01]